MHCMFYFCTRNLPVLGRWFEFQLLCSCLCLISASKITQITSGPVELSLYHSGIKDHFCAVRAASPSFRRRRPPTPLLSQSGSVYLILASKNCQDRFGAGRAVSYSFRRQRVTKNTFRPVGLHLPHSGVEGHQDHF
jgi:hypothetical protein